MYFPLFVNFVVCIENYEIPGTLIAKVCFSFFCKVKPNYRELHQDFHLLLRLQLLKSFYFSKDFKFQQRTPNLILLNFSTLIYQRWRKISTISQQIGNLLFLRSRINNQNSPLQGKQSNFDQVNWRHDICPTRKVVK